MILNTNFPPNLGFPGATTFGSSNFSLFTDTQNLYEFSQSFNYTHSRHELKFGFDFEHVGTNINGPPQNNGALHWASLQAMLTDQRFDQFSDEVPGGSAQRSMRQQVYGAYLQDDWKLRQNLTINLGVRYETFTTPTEKWGRISVIKDWIHDTSFSTGVPFWQNPSEKNFSPRIGFSWDPKGDGKTAIRGGFGIFYSDLLGPYFRILSTKNPPYNAVIGAPLGNLATLIPDILSVGPTLLTAKFTPNSFPQAIQYNLNSPYDMKFNFAIQRQFSGGLSLTVGYVGDRGVHEWTNADINNLPTTYVNGRGFIAPGTSRPNPTVASGSTYYTDGRVFYNGLQVEVKKILSHGLQFQSSFTWSKTIDQGGNGPGADFAGQPTIPQDPYAPLTADQALSPLDQQFTWVTNGTYDLPSPAGSGFSSHILGGWELSSILSISSGTPFTVNTSGLNAPNLSETTGTQRPDPVPGRSYNSIILGTPNKYFDPTAYVLPPKLFYGTVGRNTLIGPGFASMDLSLFKSAHLPIAEATRLEFRADFFNLLNRPNFAVPSSTQILNPTTGAYVAGAGKITSTVGTSRQLQFGLKFIF